MKNKFLILVSVVSIGAAVCGCVNTVSGTRTAGVPWVSDRVQARYPRKLDQVFNATKDVVMRNGTISSAGSLFNQTNEVRVLEAKVRQDNVWIRIEAVEPNVTQLTVQTRTTKGGTDMQLAHELDKEIALELSR